MEMFNVIGKKYVQVDSEILDQIEQTNYQKAASCKMNWYKKAKSNLSEIVWRGLPDGTSMQNTQMRGYFFTTSKELALAYSQGSGNVKSYRLVLENPLQIDFSTTNLSLYEIQQEVEKHLRGLASIFENQTDNPDGLIVKNAHEGGIAHTEYVVFKKNQIIPIEK